MHPNPVALVTGGSRGIGRGICVALAREGYTVAINFASTVDCARETQGLVAPAASILAQGDVSSAADRARVLSTVLTAFGRLDVLVNNAAITSVGRLDLLDATEESWDRVLAVNLKGPFFLTQFAAREMIRLRPHLKDPAVVNVSSLSAYAVSTNRGDYCVSKAGLGTVTQLWALRLAEHGIRVFEVRPGVMNTDMTAGAKEQYSNLIADGLTPIRRWGTPEDVGKAVAALVTGAIPFSTGEVLNVDGGFHLRRFPG
jgi:NAD(P)-dependent dehydrogenase (short-subunit alcohol dehydrogenase family)